MSTYPPAASATSTTLLDPRSASSTFYRASSAGSSSVLPPASLQQPAHHQLTAYIPSKWPSLARTTQRKGARSTRKGKDRQSEDGRPASELPEEEEAGSSTDDESAASYDSSGKAKPGSRKAWNYPRARGNTWKEALGVSAIQAANSKGEKWTTYRLALFIVSLAALVLSLGALVAVILTWLHVMPVARVLTIINHLQLSLATAAAATIIATSLLGVMGAFLPSPAFLALFVPMLFASVAVTASVGYTAYKMRIYNLQGKLLGGWARLSFQDAGTIQNTLTCCGSNDPFTNSILTPLCFPRSLLPGCLAPLIRLERRVLYILYTSAFSTCGLLILMIALGLVGAGHVRGTADEVRRKRMPGEARRQVARRVKERERAVYEEMEHKSSTGSLVAL